MPVPPFTIPGPAQWLNPSLLPVGSNQHMSSQPSIVSQVINTEPEAQTVVSLPPQSSQSDQADPLSVSQPEPQQRQQHGASDQQSQEQPHHQEQQSEVTEDISEL